MAALALTGCGEDDDDKASCGSPEAPLLYTVENVTPAPGSTVTNAGIVHSFALKGNDVLAKLTGAVAEGHTAGLPAATLTWSAMAGNDAVIYQAAPMSWTDAPAEVRLNLVGTYTTDDGCYYKLPAPLFSYSVTAAE